MKLKYLYENKECNKDYDIIVKKGGEKYKNLNLGIHYFNKEIEIIIENEDDCCKELEEYMMMQDDEIEQLNDEVNNYIYENNKLKDKVEEDRLVINMLAQKASQLDWHPAGENLKNIVEREIEIARRSIRK